MIPYPGIGGRDVRDFLLNGFRLEKPSETPFEMYVYTRTSVSKLGSIFMLRSHENG